MVLIREDETGKYYKDHHEGKEVYFKVTNDGEVLIEFDSYARIKGHLNMDDMLKKNPDLINKFLDARWED